MSSTLTSRQKSAKQSAISYLSAAPGVAAFSAGESSIAPNEQSNIMGVGVGTKVTLGTLTQESAIRIYVHTKIPKHELTDDQVIPSVFEGVPTDVIEVGDIVANQIPVPSWQRRRRHRPTECGVSVGHPNITAGTLGGLVEKNGVRYILSNNHVLADRNRAAIGDPILQPGPSDGGINPNDCLAVLSEFQQIQFGGVANSLDAAIAEVGSALGVPPATQADVVRNIIAIGRPRKRIKRARLYQSVRKHGRTTGHTIGVIMDLSADIWVRYGNQRAYFVDQLGIIGVGPRPFSLPGDSGSLIVDAETRSPTGLLFAGGQGTTFANRIEDVLQHFGVTIA